jgi:hypothetical protein
MFLVSLTGGGGGGGIYAGCGIKDGIYIGMGGGIINGFMRGNCCLFSCFGGSNKCGIDCLVS